MADLGITGLKNEVDVQIYTNHAQAITGAIMNDMLIDTIDTLKNGGNLDAKSVDTAQLADGAVEALQINTGAVTEAKIGTGAVETAKIKDLNVTTSKLAAKNVTSEKLADDAIVRTFAGAVLLNPYSASLTPRRVGDIAINTTSGEIWQSTSLTNAAASWNCISAGYYNGRIITNWDTHTQSGDITSYSTATGAPTSAESFYGHHINSNAGTANAVQWAIGYTTNKIYMRTKTASTWGAWSTGITAVELGYLAGVTSNIQSQIDGVETNIAPEWVANTSYTWYDFVMHNNLLYMCISTHSDATWIEGHWLVKDVGKALTSNYHNNSDLEAHLSDTATALDTTVDNFAIPWRSNSSYVIGELVIREYKLYRCKTANNDSVWNASKWTQVSLRGEINPQLFTGAALLNPFDSYSNNIPRRIGDFAINTASGEIWQATATANAAASWELQPSVAYVEVVKENVDSINIDNLGDVRAKSIDMDELPKVCDFPMYIISATVPNVAPDFITQHWIDTVAKKVYVAVGVSSAADFVVLN